MNKTELKKLINYHFGFQVAKIKLLECSGKTSSGRYSYVMFEVCGVEYQMNFDYSKGHYILKVYESHGYVEA